MEEENLSKKPLVATESTVNTNEKHIDAHPSTHSPDADCTQKPNVEASVFLSEKGEKSTPKKPAKKKPAGKPHKKQKTTKQMILGLLIKIAVIVLAIWIVFAFVLGITIHYGNNMHPMIRDGDLVISLRLQKPFINAAVLYEHDGKTTVGRVIAMEGSVVDITENGGITINGNTPTEEVFYPTFPAEGSGIQYPYTVPQGKVFILNDFREDLNDSRSFGAVDLGDLKGNLLLTMRRRGF